MSLAVAVLIQGAWSRVAALAETAPGPIFALCYDINAPIPRAVVTLFSDTATWAEGRNRLMAAARAHATFDYLVFCDDDVAFDRGDLHQFVEALDRTRPLVAAPLMPKGAGSKGYRPELEVQRAVALDEQMVAVHSSLFDRRGLAPLETDHDHLSWYVACLVFEYLSAVWAGPRCHQYNHIQVRNDVHTWETGETLYRRGDPAVFLPVYERYIAERVGVFDRTVIEQFDPNASAEALHALAGDVVLP